MPRIAIVSDIHSNIHALEAVMADIAREKLDGVAFGGDIVGYGANPKQCVELVMASGFPCVMGNHDFYVTRMADKVDSLENDPDTHGNPVWMGIIHSIHETRGPCLDWLHTLPSDMMLPGAHLAHAALHDMEEWPYLSTPADATPTLALLQEPVGFFGHTHQTQLFFDRARPGRPTWNAKGWIEVPEDGRCAITVGSVGQPRDGDPRAGWVIWDSEKRIVHLKKTKYPEDKAATAILDAGLPAHSARRLFGRSSRPPHIPAQP